MKDQRVYTGEICVQKCTLYMERPKSVHRRHSGTKVHTVHGETKECVHRDLWTKVHTVHGETKECPGCPHSPGRT